MDANGSMHAPDPVLILVKRIGWIKLRFAVRDSLVQAASDLSSGP
jgi:hypothetical protein